MMDWEAIRNFKPYEFSSPDEHRSGDRMSDRFVTMLDDLRIKCQFPFIISSGYRTQGYNADINGADNSSHLRGLGADIIIRSNYHRHFFLKHAYAMEFKRIFIYPSHIHLDIDESLPQNQTGLGRY